MKRPNIVQRVIAALLAGLYLTFAPPASAASLLPNGMQTFLDNNGNPLAGGCVFFYIGGTTTPKDTYQDSGQVTPNTNPVLLDASGRAVIYGNGVYRQVVKRGPTPCTTTTTIWDRLTADPSSSEVIYAGASAGTPNTITVVAPTFNGTDGQVINYISTNTNTGGATFNPSGFGAIPIVRDGSTGPAALTGGELVATNAVSLMYDATAGTFHILSPVTWPDTSGVPVGSVLSFGGFSAPTSYAFAYGQAVSRSTYSTLYTAYTSQQTGTIASGSPTITALTNTAQFFNGMAVEAIGITGGATITSCTATTCTMSLNATQSRSGTITFFAYGDGDGSTTFNIPDYRGRVFIGSDIMGGTAANIGQVSTSITTTPGSASATVLSATGLGAGMTIVTASVPAGTTISSISGTAVTMSGNATLTAAAAAARFSVLADAQGLGAKGGSAAKTLASRELPVFTPAGVISSVFGSVPQYNSYASSANVGAGGINVAIHELGIVPSIVSTFTGTAVGGGQVFTNLPPAAVVNYIVRLTQ